MKKGILSTKKTLQWASQMETKLSALDLLEKRFPELAFLLHLLNEEPWTFCEEGKNGKRLDEFLHREDGIEKEITSVLSKIQLEKTEVLYIFGLGLGHYATSLLDYLAQDPKRDLVILENDIEVLRLFFKSKDAFSLLKHPQIHFRFLLDSKQWKPFLEERANEFPYEHAEFIALESYQKKYPRLIANMRLHLMRRTTVHHAIHMDDRFYHVLSKNVFSNFSRISTAFYANRFQNAFEDVPAIICGAGPSLLDEIETLKALQHQALIFAGGSAIAGLSHVGALPHLGVAIDPNFEEYHRFKNSFAFEVPLLYTNRLHPRVFETCNGPHGYVHAMTGGPVEKWWEDELKIKPLPLKGGFDLEALSVTTTCLELALTMGCNPIILVGIDLAFTNDKTYSAGIVNQSQVALDERGQEMRASERLLKRKDRHGNPIYTLVKWVMESEAISRFAKKNHQTAFINSTSGGIGFRGIPYKPLSTLAFPPPFDIHGRVHQLIEENRLSFDLKSPTGKLQKSLETAKALISDALNELSRLKGQKRDPENGRMIFYQMELELLDAYRLCLEQPSLTFQKTFNRLNRFASWEAAPDERDFHKWNWLYAKWNSFNDLTLYYLDSSFTK